MDNAAANKKKGKENSSERKMRERKKMYRKREKKKKKRKPCVREKRKEGRKTAKWMTASRKNIVEKNATAHPKRGRKSAIPDVGKVNPF